MSFISDYLHYNNSNKNLLNKIGTYPYGPQTDQILSEVEKKILNPLGMIPIIGSTTGAMRKLMGVIQTISFLALSIFHLKNAIFDKNEKAPRFEKSKNDFTRAVHGAVNIGRGTIEMIPIIGNLISFGMWYNNVRFSYPTEKI